MRETQRNIRAYKKRLIHVKSKIATTAILFMMSITMLVTSTFAWLVLSTAPEVSNISTSVAGNGNLEIALASSDAQGLPKEPARSQAGDGSIEDITQRNITWGNLVNLNDSSYGLQNIVLRPAMLNESSLISKPLYSVEYGADGRVDAISSDYVYTNFDKTKNEFMVTTTTSYGVRAVSNVTYANVNLSIVQTAIREINVLLGEAQMAYQNIYSNQDYMDAIAELMGKVLSAQMDDSADANSINVKTYMRHLYPMMAEFYDLYERIEQMYWHIANTQRTLVDLADIPFDTFTSLTESQLKSNYDVSLITGWDDFKADMKEMKKHMNSLTSYRTSGTETLPPYVVLDPETNEPTFYNEITYGALNPAINFVVSINECTVAGKGTDTYRVGSIGKSAALSLLGKGPYTGIITQGALKDVERYIGKHMTAKVTIPAKYIITLNLDATITTNATAPYVLPTLISSVEKLDGSGAAKPVAGDVYGMVIDFWVRTNALGSYLILEGEKETEQIPETLNGYYVYDYSYTVDVEPDESLPESQDGESDDGFGDLGSLGTQTTVEESYYFIPEEGTVTNPEDADLTKGTFYNVENGLEKRFETDTEKNEFLSKVKVAYKTIVVGYDGVNRVWEEGVDDENSTTQGKGSCYIFYPSDPLEQEQTLELLKSMFIAFVSEDGVLLSQAYMDTENAVEEAGKVTVPLELWTKSPVTEDEEGNSIYAITPLVQNEPTLITAIVYLDGSNLSNADVSSDTSTSGYLNLQFGSSKSLDNMENDELKYETIELSGSITPTEMDYKDASKTAHLTIDLKGIDPAAVTARFVRKLNESQGVLQNTVALQKGTEGRWTASVDFDMPGTYELRSVWLDGVEFDLPQPLTVTVTGFDIAGIRFALTDGVSGNASSGGYATVLTADSTISSTLSIMTTSDLSYKPTTLEAVFRGNNQSINVPLSLTSGTSTWTGTVTFTSSGTYTLDYLLVDGEYYTIPESMKKTAILQLGIRAEVQLSQSTAYLSNDEELTIDADVYFTDDSGKELRNLEDLKLSYSLNNSQIYGIDTNLEWDNLSNTYSGQFVNIESPGVYYFKNISIGENLITNAKAPVLRVISFDPPEFVSATIDEYIYAPNDDASFSMKITNSASASVAAGLIGPDGNEYVAEGYYDTVIDEIVFEVPKLDGYSQNGQWTISKVYMSDIFYNDRLYSKDENISWSDFVNDAENANNYFVWNLDDIVSDDVPREMYVVNDIKASLTYDGYDLNGDGVAEKDATLSNVYFSEAVTGKVAPAGLKFIVRDGRDNPLNENQFTISDINLSYSFTPNHPTWWTNRSSTYDSSLANLSASFDKTSDKGVYAIPDTKKINFVYPGSYNVEFTFTINGETKTLTSKEYPHIQLTSNLTNETMTWAQPDAVFTSVNPSDDAPHYISPNQPDTYVSSIRENDGNYVVDKTVFDTRTNYITDTVGSQMKMDEGHHAEVWFNTIVDYEHIHDENCNTVDIIHKHNEICPLCGKITHTHGDGNCITISGDLEEHTHGDGNCTYDHDEHPVHLTSCFDGVSTDLNSNSDEEDGTISSYQWGCDTYYSISINGKWYNYTGELRPGQKAVPNCIGLHSHDDSCCTTPEHTHSDECCTLEEHTHAANCYDHIEHLSHTESCYLCSSLDSNYYNHPIFVDIQPSKVIVKLKNVGSSFSDASLVLKSWSDWYSSGWKDPLSLTISFDSLTGYSEEVPLGRVDIEGDNYIIRRMTGGKVGSSTSDTAKATEISIVINGKTYIIDLPQDLTANSINSPGSAGY